jgi:hypothetical protein
MRAIHRTAFQSLVFTSALAAVALGLPTGFIACADAIHLDPPGAIVTQDGGTEAGAACVSNPDCAYPTPVCDTDTETCVECLVISDCASKPGTVCSQGNCQCAGADGAALTYCAGETQSCVDTTSTPTNCGACGNTCFGACSAGKCANAWSQTSTGANVPEARSHHVAVWTGSKMFVWGGKGGGVLATGGLYDPATNTWTATSTTDAPPGAYDATAVWDDVDHVVIVWGGVGAGGTLLSSGGRYDPATDTWQPTSPFPFAGRANHTAVWAKGLSGFTTTTAGMIVWGGTVAVDPTNYPIGLAGDGALYDPAQDAWFPIPAGQTNGPSARAFHVATWDSGSRMIVFGGNIGASPPDDAGATVSPVDNGTFIFTPSPAGGAWTAGVIPVLSARQQASAAWDPASTTTLVWGGSDGVSAYFGDGASLSVTAWTLFPASTGTTAPEPRVDHSAVILPTGASTSQLVVFGGDNQTGTPPVTNVLGTGWSYDTTAKTWTELPSPGPSARHNHTAVAAGSTMIVWGGLTAAGAATNTGATYNPAGP